MYLVALTLLVVMPAQDTVRAVRFTGTAEHYGSAGTIEGVVASDGRFWWRLDGPLSMEVLYDGRTVTVRDYNGTAMPVAGRDHALARLTGVLLGAPWPDREPERNGSATARANGLEFEVPTLTSLERLTGMRPAEVQGLSVHRDVSHDYAGQSRLRLRLADIQPAEASALDTIRLASGAPVTVAFRGRGMRPLTVKRAPTGQLLVRVEVNRIAGWWVFDTGASSPVIDPVLARRLGLASVGTSVVTSMFGQQAAPLYRLGDVDLGPVTFAGLVVNEMDLAPLSAAAGDTLLGIIGYDVLARAIVEFAPEQGGILIGAPEDAPAGLPWAPLHVLDRHPVVDGVLDGTLAGKFRLDTGAGPALILNSWVARETAMLTGRATQPVPGAPFDAVATQFATLALGDQTIRDVLTLVVTGGDGPVAAVFSDRALLGNVGAPVLGQFRLVLDYRFMRYAMIPS